MLVLRDPTPHVAGDFPRPPQGLLIHGSRSGQDYTPAQEFDGTRRYCVTNNLGLGWHLTIGPDRYSIHMPADRWGYSAYGASDDWIALELAQPTVAHAIGDEQVRAIVHAIQHYVLPRWPALNVARDGGMVMHSQLPEGRADGKTDVFPAGDPRWDDLRRRIIAGLGGVGQPGTGGGTLEASAEARERAINDLFERVTRGKGRIVWRGDLFQSGHWADGEERLPVVRTADNRILTVQRGRVKDVTALALDDWEVLSRGKLVVYR